MHGDPLPYRSIFGEMKAYNDSDVLTNWNAGNDEFHRIGFLMAAEIVAKHMLERRTGRELTVYPMLFCLRHFVELCCKRIIAMGSLLGLSMKPLKHHDICELWSEAREVIDIAPFVDYKPTRDRIETFVAELASVDERSTALRYALQNGKPSLGDNAFKIDLAAVVEHVDETCRDLAEYAQMMEAAWRRRRTGEP
jgi:hypothetical protein